VLAGCDTDTAVGGLTAFSLLGTGGLLALPLFALPTILGGAAVSPGLVHTALLGLAGFVLYSIFGVIVLGTGRPVAALGCAAQSRWNKVTRGRRPVTGLDQRLLAERDTIRAVLGRKWRQAVVLTTGRLGFDYGCLLAALRATGASPRPSLVLLAYSAAGILALFPITPGGLGIVETSLSGLLILAGVRPGYAVLPTLAYRIASYWLPLLAGPPAYLLFCHRYGRPAPPARHAGRGRPAISGQLSARWALPGLCPPVLRGVRQGSAEGLEMGIFGDGRGQPASGRTAVKRPRPVAGGGWQVPCDRCHVASAKVEVITRAGSVCLCSRHHQMHRNAILAAGCQVRACLLLGL
jgi:Lysylphosphatidylglycerol synthase TM region